MSSEKENEHQSIKDIEFLMKNKAEIFNITPPNAKAEDKFKDSQKKYYLAQKSLNPTWKGFKNS